MQVGCMIVTQKKCNIAAYVITSVANCNNYYKIFKIN